jgi:TamB, inner membrane protein subunit of TAM complex
VNTSPPSSTDSSAAQPPTLLRRVVRQVENVLFGLFLLLVVMYLILQTPVVQNWLIGKVTGYLSEELETKVSVERINVALFDHLVLEGLYVEDLQGDTLLYAGKFSAGLNSNLLTLIYGDKLEFNEIALSHARFNMRRREGQENNNLKFLLDYFKGNKPQKKDKKPAPFRLKIQNLYLTDVALLDENIVRGYTRVYRLPSGSVRLNQMNLAEHLVDIQNVNLSGLYIGVSEYPGKPLPVAQKVSTAKLPSLADTIRKAPDTPLLITIARFSLSSSAFSLDKLNKPRRTEQIACFDWNHLNVQQIDIQGERVRITSDLVFEGLLRHFAARETQSGFELSHSEARRVFVSDTLTALYGVKIQTPASSLGDTIELHYKTYRDYYKFTDNVFLDLRLAPGSTLRLGDLPPFSPPLTRNVFFKKNMDKVANIAGRIYGRVSDLKADNMAIGLGEKAIIEGKFRGDDLDKGQDRLRFTMNFDRLQTDLQTIRDIIPGFSAPSAFNALGNIYYEGSYDLFFGYNHVLNGNIRTDVGSGKLDMQLDLTDGTKKAKYSGLLNMRDFDLAKWTGNKEFGRTSFEVRIKEGSSGLTLPTMRANLEGKMDTFTFRGYTYRDIKMDGIFDDYIFKGELGVEDANIDFSFNGVVNLKDTVPEYSFTANVVRLDMGKLNLVNEDWIVSGKADRIDLRFSNLGNIEGSATLRDLQLLQDHEYVHRVDSLFFASGFKADGTRYASVESDVADGYLDGRFDRRIVPKAIRMFSRNFPELSQQMELKPVLSTDTLDMDVVNFNIWVKNSRGLTRLFAADLDTLRDVRLDGNLNLPQNYVKLNFSAPFVRYRSFTLDSMRIDWEGKGSQAQYELTIPSIILPNGKTLPKILLDGKVRRDRLSANLVSKDPKYIASVNLKSLLTITPDSLWQVQFDGSDIRLFNEQWFLDDENSIRFGRQYVYTEAFELMNGDRRILLDGLNEGKGVKLSFTNFNLDILNTFLPKNLQLRGKIYDFEAAVQDIFRLSDVKGYLNTDTVFVNNQPCGLLDGNVEWPTQNAPVWWRFFLRDGRQVLRSVGAYLPKNESDPRPKSAEEIFSVRPDEFQTIIDAYNYPINLLQQLIPGISGLKGNFSGQKIKLGGPFNRVGMDGGITLHEAEMQLDYLKTKFYIKNQKVMLTDYQIWAAGDTIYDASRKSMAFISKRMGGLRHDHFSNWTIDCELETPDKNFILLNTKKADNSLYYGYARGSFNARFTGTFVRTNMVLRGVTGKQTVLYIPVTDAQEAKAVNFINFISKTKTDTSANKRTANTRKLEELKGLNIEMNLSITEDAEVQLIFDEQAGDIVKGIGEGDLLFTVNREGEFKMYGNYTIVRGEYLFTLLNFVNKPFTVANGGTIRWDGDPFGAQINLKASYRENASIYNLIREELEITRTGSGQGADIVGAAQRPQQVIVTMYIEGDLLKPNLRFDIQFPNLVGDLKSLTDSKMRQLSQDQAELSRQVFGLIVVGSFLPGNTGFIQNSDYLSSGINTVTQMLTNQLSSYLSGLASEWFGKKVSNVDFDIAYNEYRNALRSGGNNVDQTGRELQLRLSSSFINDRVTVRFGSNFGLGRPDQVSNGYLGEDVTVEIQLTANRQWLLKVYQRSEPDLVGNTGSRRRYGFGLSFRKEYDSFAAMINGADGIFTRKRPTPPSTGGK